MKIAIVNTWAISKKAVGGTERFVMDLAKSFADNGNEVDVYMFSGNTHIEDGVNYININLFNMVGEADEYIVQEAFGNFETDKSYLSLAEKLERKINMGKYDFIQLNSLLFLEAWKDKKRIFTIHTNPFEYILAWGEKSFKKAIDMMKKYKNDDNTKFVAPSEFYANEYKKLTACEINFIPHAIDKSRMKTDKSVDEICEQYDIDKNKIKIHAFDSITSKKLGKKYKNILAAGPLLLKNGVRQMAPTFPENTGKATKGNAHSSDVPQGFFKRHPRAFIGITPDNQIMMVVVDGRFKKHSVGMSIDELSYLAKQLGMRDALNLDGGGSSTLWNNKTGIVNHPYDNKKFDHEGEREVSNAILVIPHK